MLHYIILYYIILYYIMLCYVMLFTNTYVYICLHVMQEHQASTSGTSKAATSPIQLPAKQSALHINATAGDLAQTVMLPQSFGRARQVTYHVGSHQASASGRSLLEESGSSLRFVGSSAASCSTSFSDSQAAVRSMPDSSASSSFTEDSSSQADISSRPGAAASSSYTAESSSHADMRSRPGAAASSSYTAESSSHADTRSRLDASASSSYTAESSSAAGTAGIASRVSSSISTAGKALLGTVNGLGIPDASTHGTQRQSPGTWQASDVPELLFSIVERTPVVGRLTTVPIAAAQFGVKALVTATAGSRSNQTAQTEVRSALQFAATDVLISTGFELEQLCV